MNRHDVIPNPLSDFMWDELDPILTAIYDATPSVMLEGYRNGGVQMEGEVGGREFRPSTDKECCQVTFDLIVETITLDARKPMFQQLSDWLKQIADQIDEARANLERIEGVRDVVIVPRKQVG